MFPLTLSLPRIVTDLFAPFLGTPLAFIFARVILDAVCVQVLALSLGRASEARSTSLPALVLRALALLRPCRLVKCGKLRVSNCTLFDS